MRPHTHLKSKSGAQRGQVLIVTLVFFSLISISTIVGVTSPVMREVRMGKDLYLSKQSYFTAEAGSEDAYHRIRSNMSTSFPSTLALNGATTTITLETIDLSNQEIVSVGNMRDHIRTVVKEITVADGTDFNFALQTGIGGIVMSNNASVNGNVYSNGSIISTNTNANNYNYVHGGIVSAGPSGFVQYVHATGTVYSHTIKNATIDGDAYYQTFDGATSSVTVAGTKYPDSADQPVIELPLTDELIEEWENDASIGGSVTCTNGSYTISASVTIGPKKIPCDLTISGNGTIVTLTGAIWVTGNITITGSGGTGVQIRVADAVGNRSVPIIADNAGSNLTSAIVTIDGNSNFYGSAGNSGSYVMLISQNNSAETGGANLAMDIINGATGNLLTYAGHGQIRMQNNVYLRSVTAYKITLINNAIVNYSVGLAQPLFTTGAGSSWKVRKWKER